MVTETLKTVVMNNEPPKGLHRGERKLFWLGKSAVPTVHVPVTAEQCTEDTPVFAA